MLSGVSFLDYCRSPERTIVLVVFCIQILEDARERMR